MERHARRRTGVEVLGMALLIVCLIQSLGLAQEVALPGPQPGKTWPWVYNHIYQVVNAHHATPAELRAIEANLLKIVDLLKSTPMLNPPMGFDVRYTGTLLDPDPDFEKRITAMPYWLEFAFMDYLTSPSNSERHGTFPDRGLEIFINNPNKLMHGSTAPDRGFTQHLWTDKEGEFWIEPPSDDLQGYRLYRIHDVLAVTRAGASVWRPVPLGRFLPVYLAEKKKGAADAERRLASARKAYDDLTSPESEARHQKTVEAAKASGRNADAEVLRLEKIRRRHVEDAKAETQLNPSNPKHTWYFAPKQALADAEALASSFDAAGLKAPACITGNVFSAALWEYRLVPDGSTGCHRIVEPNLTLFDNRLPRTAMQLIIVRGVASCEHELRSLEKHAVVYPGGCPGTVKLASQFDWQKLEALLGK